MAHRGRPPCGRLRYRRPGAHLEAQAVLAERDVRRSGVPRAGEVLLWVLCLLALQGAAGLLQSLLSPAMEFFRTKSKVVSGTAETSVSLALYTAVAAPVTEELLFRGAVLRSLQPYGKRFAIFCSALLFGLVHQNLTQTPFAFGFGLLAGYVAMEYSILWSMSLHILNNAVLALGWTPCCGR